jgi:uncharacterized membrane protein
MAGTMTSFGDSGGDHRPALGSAIVTGLLLGVGIAGFIDETIFHQLLQWHNFYWGTTEYWRIFSDGLFHLVTTLLLLWGTFRLWRDPYSTDSVRTKAILGGLFVGVGGFNAYDGVVQHVIFHFHLVQEHVCPKVHANNSIISCPADIPYEIVWISMGIIVIAIGVVFWRHARRDFARYT